MVQMRSVNADEVRFIDRAGRVEAGDLGTERIREGTDHEGQGLSSFPGAELSDRSFADRKRSDRAFGGQLPVRDKAAVLYSLLLTPRSVVPVNSALWPKPATGKISILLHGRLTGDSRYPLLSRPFPALRDRRPTPGGAIAPQIALWCRRERGIRPAQASHEFQPAMPIVASCRSP